MPICNRFAGALLAIWLLASAVQPASAQTYNVATVNTNGTTEYRCFLGTNHFLSIIDDGNGTFALRPHPGVDVNGWGSTLYLQPFLPGAVLGHTATPTFTIFSDHIAVAVGGAVSRGASATYGSWAGQLDLRFDPVTKHVTGSGSYAITLDGPLTGLGDLNLLKIASNFLNGVPLLTCGTGDSGDMSNATVDEDVQHFVWHPPSAPAFFPQDLTDTLAIVVEGRLNQVDTLAQGHAFGIAAAYKPLLSVGLTSNQAGIDMIFGAIYDLARAQDFAADNVGITPLILGSTNATQFSFGVTLDATALPGDGHDVDFDGIPDASDPILRCATCPGDVARDCHVDGRDVGAFVTCLLAGSTSTPGCGCADMDASGTIDQAEVTALVARLLGTTSPSTACP